MKTLLNITSLLSVTTLVLVAAADSFGANVSSPALYALPFAAFIAGQLLSTFRDDYNRSQARYEPRTVKTMLLPADEAFTTRRSTAPSRAPSWTARHRRIRREAARF